MIIEEGRQVKLRTTKRALANQSITDYKEWICKYAWNWFLEDGTESDKK